MTGAHARPGETPARGSSPVGAHAAPAPDRGGPVDAVLPDRARVVIIGGGIIGTSIAYHLAGLGWTDTLLLERDRLTSGTTWHAAGLMVTFGSLSQTSTELRTYTRDLYQRLEAETGQATGLRPVGLIEVAADPGRLEEYRRVAAFNRHLGVDVHEIGPRDVGRLFPAARTDDLLAGFYSPHDGRVNPVDVTMALAKGARMRGVTLIERTPVADVIVRDGAVAGVRTDRGTIECEYVVNAAGMWARQLGERHGVCIPLQAAEHYYLITGSMSQVDPDWPVLEDPGRYTYIRPEAGGLMVGLFETQAAPWQVQRIPEDFSFGRIAPDWYRMAPYVEAAMGRVPQARTAGVRTFFCGPESFTADLQPVIGEAPEVRNYFVAAGMNSIGILSGGGWGRALAHWISTGRPDLDVTAVNIDRFHPNQATPAYRAARAVESLGTVYQCHYPGRQMRTARGLLHSPVHDRLRAHGAHFREVGGWEVADWFAGAGAQPLEPEPTWGRPDYWAHWRAEHEAVRNAAGLFDRSSMAKISVSGPDAGALLEWLSAAAVAAEALRVTYTMWLNDRGTIEADVTVLKRGDDEFLVVAPTTSRRHVLAWLHRHGEGRRVRIADRTAALAMLTLAGPRSRDVLRHCTGADVSAGGLPFRGVRSLHVAATQALCARTGFVGELGFDLFVPAPAAAAVYDAVVSAGAGLRMRPCGWQALRSLRLEAGHRAYGVDLDNTDDPLEVGPGFAVARDKAGAFRGREAVAARREALQGRGASRRLVHVVLREPAAMLFHAEVVRRDDVDVGYVRSASYGHTLGRSVGLAMVDAGRGGVVDARWLAAGRWGVQIGTALVPAEVSIEPGYDPGGHRMRG